MKKIISLYNQVFGWLIHLEHPALLIARLYVAWVFFKSGLTKINDWESTLLLFEYEYAVPVLNFELAAYLATFGELVLPVLLAIGLFTRKAAIGLFIVNYIAVISLEDIAPAALYLHYVWGIALLGNIIWGAGKLGIDQFAKIK
ncbi:DoxX family protein [Agaribacter marinus]|uniref:Membrane protein n=1 Tax=Agaribacter marinus TaxID=1431249 RepID=A0AA37SZN3_9ALTE|nr:DoxX family protein [Agaribacter marinus]GLR70965.1 membrane protein [Agaribacter marinus]